MVQAFSLAQQFHFYKSYHSNPVNRLLHFVFIPVLIFTFLALAIRVTLPPPVFDLSNLITGSYILYCLILDVFIGLCFAPFLLALHAAAIAFSKYAGSGTVPWAITINLAAWVAQFVGHFAFEGKSPALFDSLVNSVLAAPIVIFLELVFALGLMPDLKARLARSRVVAKARKAIAREKET